MTLENERISLLWPNLTYKEKYNGLINVSERAMTDLGIDHLMRALSIDSRYNDATRELLVNLCNDEEVLRYRLDVLDDFYRSPGLAAEFERVLPLIRKLDSFKDRRNLLNADHLRNISWRSGTLEIYVQCIDSLKNTMDRYADKIVSAGLRRLQTQVNDIAGSETFTALKKELPEFRRAMDSISSVTIGVNLDPELKPAEAVFLTVEPKPFTKKKSSLLSNLLGLKLTPDDSQGVPLYQNIMKINNSALEQALMKCLEEVFQSSILSIDQALQKYVHYQTDFITALEFDLAFFIGAHRFLSKLTKAGFTVCKPKPAPAGERVFRTDHLVDVILCNGFIQQLPDTNLNRTVIGNAIEFPPGGSIFILTGPNQGGKTTYTRSIGIAQLLFQAGIFVPSKEAEISPVDWIFTHFCEEEKPNTNNGRLGDESMKLAEIFKQATEQSLLLLNESLSSTSPRDSYFLARDVIKGIKLIGCRAVFATHILELAAKCDEINEELPGESKLISMVACVDVPEGDKVAHSIASAKRTFKIVPGPPSQMSFAKDIARKYGISFEQIVETLGQRKQETGKLEQPVG
jgi:hypothetical protein